MASADVSHEELQADLDATWRMDVCLELSPGLRVRVDRLAGDVPLMLAKTSDARLVVGFGLADVRDLDADHVRLAEAFAVAARELADEVCDLVARKYS
jgi:hypothetical protein